jgi:hypothetical protein
MKDANCVSLVAFMPKIDHHSKLAPIDNQGLELDLGQLKLCMFLQS